MLFDRMKSNRVILFGPNKKSQTHMLPASVNEVHRPNAVARVVVLNRDCFLCMMQLRYSGCRHFLRRIINQHKAQNTQRQKLYHHHQNKFREIVIWKHTFVCDVVNGEKRKRHRKPNSGKYRQPVQAGHGLTGQRNQAKQGESK